MECVDVSHRPSRRQRGCCLTIIRTCRHHTYGADHKASHCTGPETLPREVVPTIRPEDTITFFEMWGKRENSHVSVPLIEAKQIK